MDLLVQMALYDAGYLPSEVKTVDVQMIEIPPTLHNEGKYMRSGLCMEVQWFVVERGNAVLSFVLRANYHGIYSIHSVL